MLHFKNKITGNTYLHIVLKTVKQHRRESNENHIPLRFISRLLPLSAEMLSPQIRDTDADIQRWNVRDSSCTLSRSSAFCVYFMDLKYLSTSAHIHPHLSF